MDTKKKRSGGFGSIFFMINIIGIVWAVIAQMSQRTTNKKYKDFESDLKSGRITDVVISQNAEVPTGTLTITFTDGSRDTLNVSDVVSVQQKLDDKNITYTVRDVKRDSVWMTTILPFGMCLIVVVALMLMMTRQAGGGGNAKMMNFGKSRARMISGDANKVTFKDVAGLNEEKEELEEIVDFLKDPVKYTNLGARIPKGVILTGPPGTGKTLLAKAVAGEAGVPFFSISGSDFVEMFVGVGASRVRDLFQDAKKNAPCIIFIDEIDAVARRRGSGLGGGHDEREQTLNQLLVEMDGFGVNEGIIVMAATNRKDILDPAILRPGRFDRRVIVEKPDLQGRIDTLKVHSRNVKMDETVDLRELALATAGAVGADLANIINEAALTAVRSGRSMVSQADLIGAVELVFAGKEKKGKLLGDQEKKVVAYHEVGHALLVALQKHTEPVQRITIVPRTMGSLGYVWQVPEEEKYMETKAELEANIVTTLGGRAAEELKFESVTTGAANDIEQATKTVRAMITMYGMSDKFGLMQLETVQGKYLDRNAVLQCSDKTAAKVDEEIRNQLKKAYDEAKKLLSEHMNALDAIAQYLIEKESITGQEFMDIFNRVENAEQNVEQE